MILWDYIPHRDDKMGFLILVMVALTFGECDSQAGVLRVAKDGSGEFMTIQSAVNVAASGDTVVVQHHLNPYIEIVTVQIPLTLIGRGVACGGESDPEINGTVIFSGNSSGSTIAGLSINGFLG